jgi:hypothetical protein
MLPDRNEDAPALLQVTEGFDAWLGDLIQIRLEGGQSGARLEGTSAAEAHLGRSAPVPGRSNVRKQWGHGTFERAGRFGACCARGRAHSGATSKKRPAERQTA